MSLMILLGLSMRGEAQNARRAAVEPDPTRGLEKLHLARLLISLILALSWSAPAFAQSNLTKHDDPVPRQFQIGDLLLQVPSGQRVIINGPRGHTDFDYSKVERFPGAYRVDGMSILGMDAWQMAGSHPNARSWEYTALLVRIEARKDAMQFDDWCKPVTSGPLKAGRFYNLEDARLQSNGFYIFGETNSFFRIGHRIIEPPFYFFGSPVLLATSAELPTLDPLKVSPKQEYFTFVALTPNTSIFLRFADDDLHPPSVIILMGNIETSLRSWLRDTPHLDALLVHKPPGSCPSSVTTAP